MQYLMHYLTPYFIYRIFCRYKLSQIQLKLPFFIIYLPPSLIIIISSFHRLTNRRMYLIVFNVSQIMSNSHITMYTHCIKTSVLNPSEQPHYKEGSAIHRLLLQSKFRMRIRNWFGTE